MTVTAEDIDRARDHRDRMAKLSREVDEAGGDVVAGFGVTVHTLADFTALVLAECEAGHGEMNRVDGTADAASDVLLVEIEEVVRAAIADNN